MDDGTTYNEREVVIPLSPHVPAWVLVDTVEQTHHYVGPHPAIALRCVLTSVSGAALGERSGLVLWVVDCPSRRTSFVACVVTGAVAIVTVTR